MLPKLKLEDLRIGMEVDIDQLSEIYDTVIVLTSDSYESNTGTIEFIGNEHNEESHRIINSGKVIASIFHSSQLLDREVVFDE